MKIRYKIGLILISIFMLIPTLHAQVIDTVCVGDMGVMYSVQRSPFLYNSTFVWTVDGGRFHDYSANGDTIIVDWGMSDGTFRLSVFEITENDCEGDIMEAEVEVFDAPDIDIGTTEEFCLGDDIKFSVPDGYTSYLWSNGNTTSTYLADSGSSSGDIWVQVSNELGCTITDSLSIIVHPKPIVDIGNDTTLCGSSTATLDAGDFTFYSWSTGEITREIEIGEGGKSVWVEVEDKFGCITSDTLLVERCDVEDYLGDITNAFTPGDEDQQNKVWRVRRIDAFPDASVVIYDRWGRLIYQNDNIGEVPDRLVDQVWDGKNMKGRDMPMATYFYVIDIKYEDAKPLSGTVTIIR